MTAQIKSTFIYELSLYPQYRHPSMWGEREKNIQQEHIIYLDRLTKDNKLEIAGISSQGQEEHLGFVLLRVTNFEEAKEIALKDPSVKGGMMSVKIKPVNIYFEGSLDE